MPVNKTSRAFTKPVDQIVGEAVRTWETRATRTTRGTGREDGELVHFLFMFRGHPHRPGIP